MRASTDLAVWVRSLLWAFAAMAAIPAIAVLGNIAVGRVIHWTIVTGFGFGGLALLTLVKRHSD